MINIINRSDEQPIGIDRATPACERFWSPASSSPSSTSSRDSECERYRISHRRRLFLLNRDHYLDLRDSSRSGTTRRAAQWVHARVDTRGARGPGLLRNEGLRWVASVSRGERTVRLRAKQGQIERLQHPRDRRGVHDQGLEIIGNPLRLAGPTRAIRCRRPRPQTRDVHVPQETATPSWRSRQPALSEAIERGEELPRDYVGYSFLCRTRRSPCRPRPSSPPRRCSGYATTSGKRTTETRGSWSGARASSARSRRTTSRPWTSVSLRRRSRGPPPNGDGATVIVTRKCKSRGVPRSRRSRSDPRGSTSRHTTSKIQGCGIDARLVQAILALCRNRAGAHGDTKTWKLVCARTGALPRGRRRPGGCPRVRGVEELTLSDRTRSRC